MNKTLAFARRNTQEILRDPISLVFGIGFPVVLLALLTLINNAIPKEANMTLFHLENLTPGVEIFGLSFIALFSALLVSKDRSTALMQRLLTSQLTAADFILGYTVPLVPMSLAQGVVTFAFALCLGLAPTWGMVWCILLSLPAAVVFIGLGLLCGTLLSDKAVGGVCGALLTNLSAWLSGTWFSIQMVGGVYERICYILPFANAVDAGRAALQGQWGEVWSHLWIVCAWALVLLAAAVGFFCRTMRGRK